MKSHLLWNDFIKSLFMCPLDFGVQPTWLSSALDPFGQRFDAPNQRDSSSTKEFALISTIAAIEAEAADSSAFNGLIPRSLWELSCQSCGGVRFHREVVTPAPHWLLTA